MVCPAGYQISTSSSFLQENSLCKEVSPKLHLVTLPDQSAGYLGERKSSPRPHVVPHSPVTYELQDICPCRHHPSCLPNTSTRGWTRGRKTTIILPWEKGEKLTSHWCRVIGNGAGIDHEDLLWHRIFIPWLANPANLVLEVSLFPLILCDHLRSRRKKVWLPWQLPWSSNNLIAGQFLLSLTIPWTGFWSRCF